MNEEHTPPTNSLWDRWNTLSAPKRVVLGTVIILGLIIVLTLVRSILYGTAGSMTGVSNSRVQFSAPTMMMDGGYGVSMEESAVSGDSYAVSKVAYTERAPIPTEPDTSVGMYDEAAYEARSYRATIKTGSLEPVCDTIDSWKENPEVLFERAQRNEQACVYRMKVVRAHAEQVLAAIEAFKPTELTGTTESMKKQLVQYDGQLDILLQKQKILTDTLESANDAYDELALLARNASDVEVLTKVLAKKLSDVERLSNERVRLAGQLQALTRQMAEVEDRIEFVYFDVSVMKREVLDLDAVKDSWTAALRSFVWNINHTLQSITLGLMLNLLVLAQLALYLVIVLVVVKYGWRAVRAYWKS